MTAVRRLNHAVLYVRDARRSAAFYGEALGFVIVGEFGDGAAIFMRGRRPRTTTISACSRSARRRRAPSTAAPASTTSRGKSTRSRISPRCGNGCSGLGALVGESDHGVSKSLYAHDPDGIEFEVMWTVPRGVGSLEHEAVTQRLDLPAELARWG